MYEISKELAEKQQQHKRIKNVHFIVHITAATTVTTY